MYPAPACRFGRFSPGGAKRFAVRAGLVGMVFFLLKFLVAFFPIWGVSAGNIAARMVYYYQLNPLFIVTRAMPVLGWASFEGDGGELTPERLALELAGAVGRVSLHSPVAVLQSQIPLLATVEVSVAPPVSLAAPPLARPVSSLPGESLICIYNTHTGETYSMTDGVERLDGKHGGVVTVAAALQEALEEKHGIRSARSDRINDIKYSSSYLESEKTARDLLAANPGARLLLDIHRDSEKTREQSVIRINGREAAPILLVVGSDARRPFPAWRQNHALAQKLSNKMDQMYPGLSLGVRVKDGVYNQSLHPGALLVEVGTSRNSTEEAVYSAQLLADVLAALLSEE